SLFKSGRQQEAIQQEQRALSLINSNNLDEFYYCSACLEGFQGQRDEAARTLRSVFQHNIANTSPWDAAKAFSSLPAAVTATRVNVPIQSAVIYTYVRCPMDRS
ncbi:MAG: hypothetical protein M3Y56_06845, partial [Armatimonadota bacterium]|nr:hypothetical protein [Armatimonadota bacterium]